MRIAVIGPGAIGTLFAALLFRAGHEVWLLDRDPERAARLNTRGLRVEGLSGSWRAQVQATADLPHVPEPDLILICVKAYDTASAADSAAQIPGAAPVLTLQNGLGNVETLARRLGRGRVVGGATAMGATLLAAGRVRHAGLGETIIAEPGGRLTPRLRRVAGALKSALPVSLSEDLAGVLWTKAILNCGINPVGALTRLRNGDLVRFPHARRCVAAAVEEGAAVAAAKGIHLAYRNMGRRAEAACRATAENINSMLQDILLGRRTEVEAINGAVVRAGRAARVPTPMNAALWRLVKALEEGAGRRVPESALKR